MIETTPDSLPSVIKEHLSSSVSKLWKSEEESSYKRLSEMFGPEKVINAFSYLKANGIPPFGEITREPLSFLVQNPSLVIAFNIGFKPTVTPAQPSIADIPQDLI